MVSRRSYAREFKLSLCEEIVQGRVSKSRACREHGLSGGMLDRWVSQYQLLGDSSFPNSGMERLTISDASRVKELEAMVGRLTMELEFMRAAAKKGEELRGKGRK
jgi:transposase-like protein